MLDAEVAAFEGGAELGVEGAEGPGVGVSEEEGVVVSGLEAGVGELRGDVLVGRGLGEGGGDAEDAGDGVGAEAGGVEGREEVGPPVGLF